MGKQTVEGGPVGTPRRWAPRIYLTDMSRWQEVARAHREAFGDVRPASSMLEISRLAEPEMLVEIEAVAVVSE